MWKLKIAEGGSPWLRTLNDHVGRQFWEFDPKLGSPEELSEIEKVRDNFRNNRFQKKHSADLLMRIQFAKENPSRLLLPQVKVKDGEDITEDQVMTTLRRAISFHSTLQAHDGHWPGDYGGPMFLMPGLVTVLLPQLTFLLHHPLKVGCLKCNCNFVLQTHNGSYHTC
ncbi:hypothetical protein CsSME_00015068 [Camellia sinensis var. sinensis]